MQIAIVGAGAMGANIAQAVALGAQNETAIVLHDTDERMLRVALGRVSRGLDLNARAGTIDPVAARRAKRVFTLATELTDCADADLIIEAIFDNLSAKQELLRALDAVVSPDAVLATTTNTLSITRLAQATQRPGRVIGLHFLRPAHQIRLVEIIRTPHTQRATLDRAAEFIQRLGKTPLSTADRPGWVVNRLAHAYFDEALRIQAGGGVEFTVIDRLLEGVGFPLGPFRQMDAWGVDTTFQLSRALYEQTFHDPRFRPQPYHQQMVEAGRIGRGSLKGGFYPAEQGPDG